jgi:hypothetical protein
VKNPARFALASLDGLFEHPASPMSGPILDKQTLEDKDDPQADLWGYWAIAIHIIAHIPYENSEDWSQDKL